MHPQTSTRPFRLQKVEESALFQQRQHVTDTFGSAMLTNAEIRRNTANIGGFRHVALRLLPEIASRDIDQLSNCYQKSGRMRIFNY